MGLIGSKQRNQKRIGKSVTSLFVLTPVLWAALPLAQGVDKAFASTGKWVDITNTNSFSFPWGIAVDKFGDVFVTDRGNNSVYELAAGSSTWTNINYGTSFSDPKSVAADSSGNVFVTSSTDNTIYELAYASTSWTPVSVPNGQFHVTGIAVDNSGDLFVTFMDLSTVYEWNATTGWTDITPGGSFNTPEGIAVDSNGNVFVSDYSFNNVQEWNAKSKTWKDISGAILNQPVGVAVDSSGNVFVANSWGSTIEEGQQGTNNTWTWTDASYGGSSTDLSGELAGVAFDSLGDMFVTNASNHTVVEYAVPHPTHPFSIGTNWAWNAQYGIPYNNLQLQAGSGHGPYTWSMVNGSLPAGLTLSSDGIISGTPTGENGTSTFTVQVKDANGQTTTKTLSISVFGVHNLQVATSSLVAGVVGQAYQSKLSAVGGQGVYMWKVVQGTLPPGVTLASDGTLAGTPQKAGTYAFTVQAFDALGDSAAKYYVLNVANSKH